MSGELDRETGPEVERVVTELLSAERPQCVALDMSAAGARVAGQVRMPFVVAGTLATVEVG